MPAARTNHGTIIPVFKPAGPPPEPSRLERYMIEHKISIEDGGTAPNGVVLPSLTKHAGTACCFCAKLTSGRIPIFGADGHPKVVINVCKTCVKELAALEFASGTDRTKLILERHHAFDASSVGQSVELAHKVFVFRRQPPRPKPSVRRDVQDILSRIDELDAESA